MNASHDPVFRARLLRALLASVGTGAALLLALRGVMRLAARRLTDAQIDWLRRAFNQHPWLVLGTITGMSLLLASPVLIAFRIAFGPLKGQWRRR